MYHLDRIHPSRERYSGGTLRVGVFGATRALKNLMTASGAALQIANTMRAELELWTLLRSQRGAARYWKLFGRCWAACRTSGWSRTGGKTWPQFRQTVRHMHLLMQPSYTESFNVVTADGIAEDVPSVVSDAIEWAPDSWKAPADDACAMAEVGRKLIRSRRAAAQGLSALKSHNRMALATG